MRQQAPLILSRSSLMSLYSVNPNNNCYMYLPYVQGGLQCWGSLDLCGQWVRF